MEIVDFLPKYPNIDNTEYDLLNPYEDNFYQSIYNKKEFYDERFQDSRELLEPGMLMKHQKIIQRFLSGYTPYDSLLLVHGLGSGKSCSAVGAIEKVKNELGGKFKGAYIFAKGANLLDNFVKELRDKCTEGQYIPLNSSKLTDIELFIRSRKLYEDFYHFRVEKKHTTFETFAKYLTTLTDSQIINNFSNNIIVIDEVHNLRDLDYSSEYAGEDEEEDEDEEQEIKEESRPEEKREGLGQEKKRLKIYDQFHRFLHLVKNCKIMLMSATPMKDGPVEIASIMNLILPLDEQLPIGNEFINEYLEEVKKGDKKYYIVKQNKKNNLKQHFKGRVSFIKSTQSSIQKKFIGEKIGNLDYFTVEPTTMSEFQTTEYDKALALDKRGKQGVYYNSIQASMFVFPDGSYGKTGFTKYIKKSSKQGFSIKKRKGEQKMNYMLSQDLIKDLKGKDNEETLKNLEKYSCKYAYVIRSILESPNKLSFVYSNLVTGSGLILFSKLLELFTIDGQSFSMATGNDATKGIRYGLLTHAVSSTKQIGKIIKRFNNDDNFDGSYIKVLIGSKIISEGVSFFNIQNEYIITPWYNYSETDQALARGYRYESHRGLLSRGITPVVNIFQLLALSRNKDQISIDLYMYELSEDKDISIQKIMRLLLESAIDCGLMYNRNHTENRENERECEYEKCDYTCDGIEMKNINNLSEKEIDKSTYDLYYYEGKISLLKRKIYKLLKKYNKITISQIVMVLEKEHSEREVRNVLENISVKENSHSYGLVSGELVYFEDYVKKYFNSDMDKTIEKISNLFRTNFKLSYDEIRNNLIENNDYEVLTSLRTIVNNNIKFKDKYGFPYYIREKNNIYYFVGQIFEENILEYYLIYPTIETSKNFSDILGDLFNNDLSEYIKKLSELEDINSFNRFIKIIPDNIQNFLVESAIMAEKKNIEYNKEFRNFILKYFSGSIKKVDNTWIYEGDTLRCLGSVRGILDDSDDEKWRDCEDDNIIFSKIKEKEKERIEILERNPYKYYGKYNPQNPEIFSIVDLSAEEGERKESKESKEGRDDQRLIHSGRLCKTWSSKKELQEIVIKKLKVPCPADFLPNETIEDIRVKLIDLYEKKKDKFMYTEDEINSLNLDDARRSLYWLQNKTIEKLCSSLKDWFGNTTFEGESLLVPDEEAGKYGHPKKERKVQEDKGYKIVKIDSKNKDMLNAYKTSIGKMFAQCYNTEDILKYNNKIWYLIYLGKKMSGIVSENNGIIIDICIGKTYYNSGRSGEIMKAFMCSNDEYTNFKIELKNGEKVGNKSYKNLLKVYQEYGFEIESDDKTITRMKFKSC